MEWRKTALIASVAWLILSLAVGMAMAWQITAHPKGGPVDRERIARAGNLTGIMAGTGIGLICLGLYGRANFWPPRDREAPSARPAGSRPGRGGSRKRPDRRNRKGRRK